MIKGEPCRFYSLQTECDYEALGPLNHEAVGLNGTGSSGVGDGSLYWTTMHVEWAA